MPLIKDESVITSEWNEVLNLLSKENLINIRNNTYVQRKDIKAFSLLYNTILPFIDTIYVTCLVLFEVTKDNIFYLLRHFLTCIELVLFSIAVG